MARRLLDTNWLINHWRDCLKGGLVNKTGADVSGWARKLIVSRKTGWIATPVAIEFLAGVRSSYELKLAQAYLGEFVLIDKGNIPKADWDETRRLAQRVPRDGKARHLGDCLLRAIAQRFGAEVDTADRRFP
jgi:predicted nucleic acid-binding protein